MHNVDIKLRISFYTCTYMHTIFLKEFATASKAEKDNVIWDN